MAETQAEFIADDLKYKIANGHGLPQRLTLSSIAKQYQVSVMPVRQAIDVLVEEQVISRSSTGRLSPNVGFKGASKRKAVPPAPPTDWFQKILRDVMFRSLKGEDKQISLPETANKYGIGRTAVQTILTRLTGLGVLNHTNRCGWTVRPYKDEDLLSYLDVRELMEIRALQLARKRIINGDIERLLELNQPASNLQTALLDNSLHGYWIDRCANRYIIEFYRRESAYPRLLYEYVSEDESLRSRFAQQHRSILNAILSKNWKEAEAALSNDIKSLYDVLSQARERIVSK